VAGSEGQLDELHLGQVVSRAVCCDHGFGYDSYKLIVAGAESPSQSTVEDPEVVAPAHRSRVGPVDKLRRIRMNKAEGLPLVESSS
jgi:hypothetical protein